MEGRLEVYDERGEGKHKYNIRAREENRDV
jgi:hypothetical protein